MSSTSETESGTPVDVDLIRRWIGELAAAVHRDKDELTRLDAAIGDADHGVNLERGLSTADRKLAVGCPDTPGGVLLLVGRTLISTVGGAAGPLYGVVFRETGKMLGDDHVAPQATLVAGLRAGLDGVHRLGAANEGDKTMVDAFAPAVAMLEKQTAAGKSLALAAAAAATEAARGAEATVALRARRGRASYLGERSIGHLDPGAASTVLLFRALAEAAAPA